MTAYEIAGFEDLDEQTAKDLQDILDRIPPRWGKWLSFGKGWIPLVIQLNKDISAIDPNYELHQVKEKFGGLRYYIGDTKRLEEVRLLIQEAEAESCTICEVCSAPATLVRRNYYYNTLCPECAATLGATEVPKADESESE
jgi:hypothetical protein